MAEAAVKYSHKIINSVADFHSDQEREIFDELVRRYRNHRVGSEGHNVTTVDQALDCIKRLVLFTHKPVWKITGLDLNDWFGHMAFEQKLARNSRRNYQAHSKSFLNFMTGERDICEEIRSSFGIRVPKAICDDLRILHKTEYDGRNSRRPISRKHMKLIFRTFDQMIAKAYKEGRKEYWTLCRDKAMIYLVYANGLRREECANLTLGSFAENPSEPRFGQYGSWYVFGKGGKPRGVINLLPGITDIMDWYLEEIRPKLLDGRPDPKKLFLTEGGEPISDDVVYQAFCRVVYEAGLNGLGYTLHWLRHTYTTASVRLIGLKATQENVGHTFASTTCGYDKPPLKELGRQVGNAINRIFEKREQRSKGGA